MSAVYVVTSCTDYEGDVVIGVGATIAAAKRIVATHTEVPVRRANWTRPAKMAKSDPLLWSWRPTRTERLDAPGRWLADGYAVERLEVVA